MKSKSKSQKPEVKSAVKPAPKAPAAPKPAAKAPKAKSAPAAKGTRTVRIEVRLQPTEVVHLSGSFNDWHETALPLQALGDGRWAVELELAPGEYEYLLIADGRWLPDPGAAAWVPNPFGGINSLLRIV